jgi:hypothetical protein
VASPLRVSCSAVEVKRRHRDRRVASPLHGKPLRSSVGWIAASPTELLEL